jgi:predicted molibdopterin-dependent oxidoreductase YjgC
MMRLSANQSSQIERSELVSFIFDGQNIDGHAGENLVAALLRAGHSSLSQAPVDGAPRGAFCMMGLCQECVVRIDGQVVEACRCEVTQGLVVERAR